MAKEGFRAVEMWEMALEMHLCMDLHMDFQFYRALPSRKEVRSRPGIGPAGGNFTRGLASFEPGAARSREGLGLEALGPPPDARSHHLQCRSKTASGTPTNLSLEV